MILHHVHFPNNKQEEITNQNKANINKPPSMIARRRITLPVVDKREEMKKLLLGNFN